jgi:hypothetical protein
VLRTKEERRNRKGGEEASVLEDFFYVVEERLESIANELIIFCLFFIIEVPGV